MIFLYIFILQQWYQSRYNFFSPLLNDEKQMFKGVYLVIDPIILSLHCCEQQWLVSHFSPAKLMVQYNNFFHFMKLLESSPKVAEIESRLAKHTFLSRANLPGYLDGLVFRNLISSEKYPDRKINPNFYHWYILMRQFAPSTITKWITDRLYFDADDDLTETFTKTSTSHRGELLRYPVGEGVGSLKSGKQEWGEMEYVIDVCLKEYCKQMICKLRSCLQSYDLEIFCCEPTRQIKIKCGHHSSRRQDIVNLLSKTIEYENLQLKRQKRCKLQSKNEG